MNNEESMSKRPNRYYYSAKDKLSIVRKSQQSGNIRATARLYVVRPKKIRAWLKSIDKLKASALVRPSVRTLNAGGKVKHASMEDELHQWILHMRENGVPVSSHRVICQAAVLDPNLNPLVKSTWGWLYRFLERKGLSIRAVTHEGQKNNAALVQVKRYFNEMVNGFFTCDGAFGGVSSHWVVNMDETAVYFEPKSRTTIARKGEKSITATCSGSSMRITVCVAAAADGTRLPLFLVFKGKSDGRLSKTLDSILPPGVCGCFQENAWMDEASMQEWIRQVWKPYVQDYNGNSMLIVDEFRCHMQASFTNEMATYGTSVELIPGGIVCVHISWHKRLLFISMYAFLPLILCHCRIHICTTAL